MNMNKRKLLISILSAIAGMFFLAFVCLAILVKKNYLFDIDSQGIAFFGNIRNGVLTSFIKFFTCLGSIYVLIAVAIIMIFCFKSKRERIFISLSIVVAGLFSTLFKYLVQRGRPVNIALIEEVGYSFPSAHTMISLVVYGFLIYLLLKFMKNKPLKVVISILFALIIIVVGLTRVYLGVHFMTDIFAGWLLGACVLVVCIVCYEFAFKKYEKQDEKK